MPLPINFHRTFVPERRLLSVLLQYAGSGRSGTYQDIARETGIPMGKSNGKVPAIIDYARGMGFVQFNISTKNGIKSPLLTPFGRTVLLEDPNLGEPITQWLAHMHLCRPEHGAVAWHIVFVKGKKILGGIFTFDQLENYLRNSFGPGRDRTGPLIRMYTDDAAFARMGALRLQIKEIIRTKAPVSQVYTMAYAAYILSIIEVEFPGQSQVTIDDLNKKSGIFDACLWERIDIERVLSILESQQLISIDRQMYPWIIEKRSNAQQIWPQAYQTIP